MQYDSCMEVTISKNASQLAGDTIETFREIRKRKKAEKAEADKLFKSDISRAGIITAVALALLIVCFVQRIFF